MMLSEFSKVLREKYLFDCWVHPEKVPNLLGEFDVELLPDAGEPDERMVLEAESLLAFIQNHPDKVVEKVFEHYKQLHDNSEWLASCNVPRNLGVSGLAPYLHALSISVSREGEAEDFLYQGRIYISPQWDEEHAIYLELNESEIKFCEA